MKVTYLYHSGFAVETTSHFLVFDYWKNTPKNGSLKDGVINPNEIADKDVIVFSSHRHRDHYNSVIHDWQKVIKKCRIILSFDIDPVEGSKMVEPNQIYEEKDFTLTTFKSNDEGVAFLLDIDGLTIYHAGDLNWWHWEGEPGSWNEDIKESYLHEIRLIKRDNISIAFVTLDPRLKEQYYWGLDYFMKNINAKYVFPMHFLNKPEIVEKLLEADSSKDYRARIIPLTSRGQSIELI